jgi:hypothetical protein
VDRPTGPGPHDLTLHHRAGLDVGQRLAIFYPIPRPVSPRRTGLSPRLRPQWTDRATERLDSVRDARNRFLLPEAARFQVFQRCPHFHKRSAATTGFQVPSKPAGAWDNGTVNTCFYRRHPHAGLFAATCLPLWSLALLDAKTELREWLGDLLALAGKPVEEEEPASKVFALKPEHYALLLHLCSEEFSSDDEALKALPKSNLFRLPGSRARQYFTELEAQGLTKAGHLTKAGRTALAESSYEPFAFELEANRR